MNKIPLLFSVLCFVVYRTLFHFTGNIWLSLLIFLLPIGLVIFNFFVRKQLSFSKWFLSAGNLFLEKSSHSSESELDPELLYAKLLEVIDDSTFKLLDTDSSKLRILSGTSLSFWSWGENVYIQVLPSPGGSIIRFTSVTLFGTSSGKRNSRNFDSFIRLFESSLII